MRVAEFLIDRTSVERLGGMVSAREEVFLVESLDTGAMDLGLYLAPELFEKLRGKDPGRRSGLRLVTEELSAFSAMTEGVSHVLYLSRCAESDRQVSKLELEVQAEIDKFAVSALHLWGRGLRERVHELWERLFTRVRPRQGLSADEQDRYLEAGALGGRYARHLMDRYVKLGRLDGFLKDLRTTPPLFARRREVPGPRQVNVMKRRFVILVLDGVGVGAMPDAAEYGDAGSDTLGHVAAAAGGLHLPILERIGLGRILPLAGVAPIAQPLGSFGRMAEASERKDTQHRSLGDDGARPRSAARALPQRLPGRDRRALAFGHRANARAWKRRGERHRDPLKRLGPEHERSGDPILYTSADSVFQVAAHEEVVPLATLYAWCEAARRILDSYNVARVIARPFIGQAGDYQRTYNRRDFSIEAPPDLALDLLARAGVTTVGVGKIPDIFNGRGISEGVHTAGNADGLRRTSQLLGDLTEGFLFVNLVDTDMLYGHRNDALGFARALVEIDAALEPILAQLGLHDLLAITGDHGCDPTMPSTDHSREYVPLLMAGGKAAAGKALGTRATFADLGQTLVEFFGAARGRGLAHGTSFLGELI